MPDDAFLAALSFAYWLRAERGVIGEDVDIAALAEQWREYMDE